MGDESNANRPTNPNDATSSGIGGNKPTIKPTKMGEGFDIPEVDAYLMSDHPDARPGETGQQTHDRLNGNTPKGDGKGFDGRGTPIKGPGAGG